MTVDLLSRKIATLAGTNAANALANAIMAAQKAPSIDLFANLANKTIDASVNRVITGGCQTPGVGAGTYVADSLATAGMAAAYPNLCCASADGRYWRLLPVGGMIGVDQAGAVAGSTAAGSANVTSVRLAFGYLAAVGGSGLVTPAGTYTFDAGTLAGNGLIIPNGVSLYGVGPASVWQSTSVTSLLVGAVNNSDCWIENMTIKGGCILTGLTRGGMRRTTVIGALSGRTQYSETGINVASGFASSGVTYNDGTNTISGSDFTHTLSGSTMTITLSGRAVGSTTQQRNVLSDLITLDPSKRYVFTFGSGFLAGCCGNPPCILLYDANGAALDAGQGNTPSNLFVPNNDRQNGWYTAMVYGAASFRFQIGVWRDYSTADGLSAIFDLSKVVIYSLVNDFATKSFTDEVGQVQLTNSSNVVVTDCDFQFIDHTALKLTGVTNTRVTGNRFTGVVQGVTDDGGVGTIITDNDFDLRMQTTGGAMIGSRAWRMRCIGGTGSNGGTYSRNRGQGASWGIELLPGDASFSNVCSNNTMIAEFTGLSLTHGIWEAVNNTIKLSSDGLCGIEFAGTSTALVNPTANGNIIRWQEMSGYHGIGISLNTVKRATVHGGYISAPICIMNPLTNTGGEIHIHGVNCEYGNWALLHRESICYANFGKVVPHATQVSCYNAVFGGSAVFDVKPAVFANPVSVKADYVVTGTSNLLQASTFGDLSVSFPEVRPLLGYVVDYYFRLYNVSNQATVVRFNNINFIGAPSAMNNSQWANFVSSLASGSTIIQSNVTWNGLRTIVPHGSYSRNMVNGNPLLQGWAVNQALGTLAAGGTVSFTLAVTGASLNDPPYDVICYGNPSLLNGLIVQAMATGDNTVAVKLTNPTASSVTIGTQTFVINGRKAA